MGWDINLFLCLIANHSIISCIVKILVSWCINQFWTYLETDKQTFKIWCCNFWILLMLVLLTSAKAYSPRTGYRISMWRIDIYNRCTLINKFIYNMLSPCLCVGHPIIIINISCSTDEYASALSRWSANHIFLFEKKRVLKYTIELKKKKYRSLEPE